MIGRVKWKYKGKPLSLRINEWKDGRTEEGTDGFTGMCESTNEQMLETLFIHG